MIESSIRTQLGLGFEPIDAIRGARVARPLTVELESQLLRQPMRRHESGRYSVLLASQLLPTNELKPPVTVRVFDRRRGYVPRKLEVPLPAVTVVRSARRIRRPQLFPGVAWDLSGTETGLLARVTRGVEPVRWAQIEASRPGSAAVVLRTRADDRGEFLLVLGSRTLELTEIGPLALELRVYGPAAAPEPPTDSDDPLDPLWDLPAETLTNIDGEVANDPVLAGVGRPDGWIELRQATISFTLGRVISDQTTFKL